MPFINFPFCLGSLNGLASRPSLNKELMQKLRSMTETIKMLSDENSNLRGENDQLRDVVEQAEGVVTKGRDNNSLEQQQKKSTGTPPRNREYFSFRSLRKVVILKWVCHQLIRHLCMKSLIILK